MAPKRLLPTSPTAQPAQPATQAAQRASEMTPIERPDVTEPLVDVLATPELARLSEASRRFSQHPAYRDRLVAAALRAPKREDERQLGQVLQRDVRSLAKVQVMSINGKRLDIWSETPVEFESLTTLNADLSLPRQLDVANQRKALRMVTLGRHLEQFKSLLKTMPRLHVLTLCMPHLNLADIQFGDADPVQQAKRAASQPWHDEICDRLSKALPQSLQSLILEETDLCALTPPAGVKHLEWRDLDPTPSDVLTLCRTMPKNLESLSVRGLSNDRHDFDELPFSLRCTAATGDVFFRSLPVSLTRLEFCLERVAGERLSTDALTQTGEQLQRLRRLDSISLVLSNNETFLSESLSVANLPVTHFRLSMNVYHVTARPPSWPSGLEHLEACIEFSFMAQASESPGVVLARLKSDFDNLPKTLKKLDLALSVPETWPDPECGTFMNDFHRFLKQRYVSCQIRLEFSSNMAGWFDLGPYEAPAPAEG